MLNQTITKSLLVLLTIGFYTSNNFAAKRNMMGREKECEKECSEVFAAWQKVLNEEEKALKKTELFLDKKIHHIKNKISELREEEKESLPEHKREFISHKIKFFEHKLKFMEIKYKWIKEKMKLIPLEIELKNAKEQHMRHEHEFMNKIDEHCMKCEAERAQG